MKTIEVHGLADTSRILIGERLANLSQYTPAENVIILTDTNVEKYYRDAFPARDVLTIGTGESIKDLDTVRQIYEKLLAMEADRSCFIVGIGGGVVCDVTGFVASTYMRGIGFGFVASTLLSQVDASVGGKNGVNFKGYKNMIGTFNQPAFVICDIYLLATLAQQELLSGFGEIVKHAVLGDRELFAYLEDHYQQALDLDPAVIERLVYDSVKLKAKIVGRDEREKGERRKLNLGHTFGHAIEKSNRLSHGAAVSIGMVAAAKLAAKKGLLPESDVTKIADLLAKMKLPTGQNIDHQAVFDALKKDKKRQGDKINFVLPTGIGETIVKEISFHELHMVMADLF